MKKLIALVLVLATLFCLCACANGGEKKGDGIVGGEKKGDGIVGTWTADLDGTKIATAELGADIDIDAKLMVTFVMTLNEDGTCKLGADKEKTQKSVEAYIDALIPAAAEMVIAQSGYSREELEAQLGMSVEDLMKTQMPSDMSSLTEEILEDETGKYEVDGDKLYLIKDGETRDDANYLVFKLDGDTLTVTDVSDKMKENEGAVFAEALLPIIFKR